MTQSPCTMRCNWELNNDNLLDLSHVVYVHPTTLGSAGLENFPMRTERFEKSVRMTRWMPDVPPMPLFERLLRIKGRVDRFQTVDIDIPCHALVDAGFAPAGKLKVDDDRSSAQRACILISATPETETTSFMFYAQARNFAQDNEELTRIYKQGSKVIFDEDIDIMEAQQQATLALPDAPSIDTSTRRGLPCVGWCGVISRRREPMPDAPATGKKYDVGGVLLDRPFKVRRLGHFGFDAIKMEGVAAGSITSCSASGYPMCSTLNAARATRSKSRDWAKRAAISCTTAPIITPKICTRNGNSEA